MNAYDCDCPTSGLIFIKVGKATKLRNRLQSQAFGSVTVRPYPWFNKLMDFPHYHLIFVAAWYMSKSLISAAEAILIDRFNPTENIRDRGFSNPKLWTYRQPDVECASLASLESRWKGKKDPEDASPYIRNESGVYAWYIDPGAGLEAAHQFLHGHSEAP